MKNIWKHCLLLGFLFVNSIAGATDDLSAFKEIKSEHFTVRYTVATDPALAAQVLDRSEGYYRSLSSRIGYTRYQESWTWDRRVAIVIYPDKFSYSRWTGQQGWSKGYATRNSRLFQTKAIVTYDGQDQLFDRILPHEIMHLLWWDYTDGGKKAPIWFEEGLAQLEEAGAVGQVQGAMRQIMQGNSEISPEMLSDMDPGTLGDESKVVLFYVESLSILTFLIDRYGADGFRRLCRELRDGKSFESALARAYPGVMTSWKELETRWRRDVLEP
jgi:hypothetical protein